MEFLKEILGEELFNQVAQAINAYNGDEAHKDKQIKLGNLATGDYVAKGKYDSLDQQLQGKITELTSANSLIAEMKKATKGNEDLQGKITGYETQVTNLQAQLAETKLKSAIKVALLTAKAGDVDYMTYKLEEKLKEKGETLELDENDNIKGWESQLDGLKTQFPNMFGDGEGGKDFKPYKPEGLPRGKGDDKGMTRAELLKKPYAYRNELSQTDPELYSSIMKNDK